MNALRLVVNRNEFRNITIPDNFGSKLEVVILPALSESFGKKKNTAFQPKQFKGITKIIDIQSKLDELSRERDRL